MENKIEEFLLTNFKYYETGHSFQDYEKHLKRSEEMLRELQCTCKEDSKQRALCPICDKEEYDKINLRQEALINQPVKKTLYGK